MGWNIHYHEKSEVWSIFDARQKLIIPAYQFFLSRKEDGDAQNTLKALAYDLMHLYRFLRHKGLDMKTMEPNHISQFRTWMFAPKELRGDSSLYLNVKSSYSPKSWNRVLSSVISYAEWCEDQHGDLLINTRLLNKEKEGSGSSSKKKKKKARWKVSDMTEAIEYIPPEKRAQIKSHLNKRDRLVFDLIYFSGMRIGEVFSIHKQLFSPNPSASKVTKIELKESTLEDTDRQTKSGERYIYIPNTLYQGIAQYVTFKRGRASHDLLFTTLSNSGKSKKGAPLAPDTFRKNLALACKKSKVKYTPHDLRHTLATDLYKATNDIRLVQDVLGHKSVDTTEKYTHLLSEDVASTLGEVLEDIYDELLVCEVA